MTTRRFNRNLALKQKRAMTRDGRNVFALRKAILNGKEILIGDVEVDGPGIIIVTESAYWGIDGLGLHDGSDLVEAELTC